MKKKFLAMLLSVALLAGAIPVTASAASVEQFSDVKARDWFYDAVEYAVSNGLFHGTGETTFSPEQSMTRGMFVTVLGRKSNVEQSLYTEQQFEDVKAGQYYAPYVNWAASNGIVNGTGAGKFSPDAPITREQIAKILYGYAQKTGNDTTFRSDRFNQFFDKSNASNYAVESLEWATTHMIINGTDDGYLIPKLEATRAQVAQILYCADRILVNTEITDDPKPTDELLTLRDEAGNATLSIPIPATWKDRYTATGRSDGLGATFYSTNNLYTGHGGMLFQLSAYAGREEYIHIPSTHFLTQVTVDGVNYHIVWREPTDYQYDMEYQQEYLQMQADIPRMIEGIEFFVPIASEQPEPGAAVYWVVNGAVYHSTDQCPSLSRSKNIQSGTVEEAAAAGKTRACPNCH